MAGLGTIINCLGVIIGGTMGIFFKRGLKLRHMLLCQYKYFFHSPKPAGGSLY